MKQIHEIKPYTYLVKFKPTGKVYYGSRCQNYTKFNRTPADDFWHIYTTSSNTINDLIKEYGKDAFEYEIRRTFDTVEEMSAWETKVLKRCRVLERQDIWMNSNVAGKKILTEAGAKVISATHKDKPKTEEHKRNLSLSVLISLISLQLISRENIGVNGGRIGQTAAPKSGAAACSPGAGRTDLDLNNVRALIFTSGDMWWDLNNAPRYEVPKGSNKHSAFASALWIGGVDNGGNVKVAAMTYRQSGNDFWPGPRTL